MDTEFSLPEELVTALANTLEAQTLFDKMPPSHKKEYAKYVAEAKQSETRQRRAEQAITMILSKVKQ